MVILSFQGGRNIQVAVASVFRAAESMARLVAKNLEFSW